MQPQCCSCLVSQAWTASMTSGLAALVVRERHMRVCMELHQEMVLLEKLMYKNRNQHRGTRPFHRLEHVRREVRLLWRKGNGLDVLGRFRDILTIAAQPTVGLQERKVPLASSCVSLLQQLFVVCRLAEGIARSILGAAHQVTSQLAHGFFMPFSLACLALLARMRTLNAQLLIDTLQSYNALSEMVDMLPATDDEDRDAIVKKLRDLPYIMQCKWNPDDKLPQVHIKNWEGSRLLDLASATAWSYRTLGLILQRPPPSLANETRIPKEVISVEIKDASAEEDNLEIIDDVGRIDTSEGGIGLALIEDRGVAISREQHMAMLRTADVQQSTALISDVPPSYTRTNNILTVDRLRKDQSKTHEQKSSANAFLSDKKHRKKKPLGKVVIIPDETKEGKNLNESILDRSDGIDGSTSIEKSQNDLPLSSLSGRTTAFINVDSMISTRKKSKKQHAYAIQKQEGDLNSGKKTSWEDWLSLPALSKPDSSETEQSASASASGRKRKKRR